MKHFSHLNSAVAIIEAYKGGQPFHLFIKDFFKQHKKYGSRDRKQITHLCYCYFRLGLAAKEKKIADAIIEALFLCSTTGNDLLDALDPVLNAKASLTIDEKFAFLNIIPTALKIFPYVEALSDEIDANAFNLSHLMQPDVFIRIRPGHQHKVIDKLNKASVDFKNIDNNCIALSPSTKIQDLLQLNKEAVIQDYSSQQTGNFMQMISDSHRPISVWDCCAASGGKSIVAKDILGEIALTVSDIRPVILENLKKRLEEAGIKNFKTIQADLAQPLKTNLPSFDFIIADVPCSGSGTWGRTPEQLSYFQEQSIEAFHQLQQKIVQTVISKLKPGGHFLYITCSVFKKENEIMADFISTQLKLRLLKKQVLKGYDQHADTMFVALFKKQEA
ncbi:MAG: methyltransferase domain-containing protein [Chitinophagaceae bacterium]